MADKSTTVANGSTVGAVAKVKSAIRRVLLGTSSTTYPTAGDYKVEILCCPVSANWLTVVIGIAHLLCLLIKSISNREEFFNFKTDDYMGYFFFLEFNFEVCVTLALLVGVYISHASFLLPFRIIYGCLRVLFLFTVIFMFSAIGYVTINDYYTQMAKGNSDIYLYTRGATIECRQVMMTAIVFGIYCILGTVAEAATKCVAQMKKAERGNNTVPCSV